MGRWAPDACGRLQLAALELFGERGYEETTVADIAERAGLTKRTFFRHFADKREVLFLGGESLAEVIVAGVSDAPQAASPLDAVAHGLASAGCFFDAERRPFSAQRQQIIDANPELQERELIKLTRIADAVAEALKARGVVDPAATLSAQAGMAVFRVAFARWVQAADEEPFDALVRSSLGELRAVAA